MEALRDYLEVSYSRPDKSFDRGEAMRLLQQAEEEQAQAREMAIAHGETSCEAWHTEAVRNELTTLQAENTNLGMAMGYTANALQSLQAQVREYLDALDDVRNKDTQYDEPGAIQEACGEVERRIEALRKAVES